MILFGKFIQVIIWSKLSSFTDPESGIYHNI